MYIYKSEIENSVNDEVIETLKVFRTLDETEDYKRLQETEIEEWNALANDYRSGIQSRRYLDVEINEVTLDTIIPQQLTLGEVFALMEHAKILKEADE